MVAFPTSAIIRLISVVYITHPENFPVFTQKIWSPYSMQCHANWHIPGSVLYCLLRIDRGARKRTDEKIRRFSKSSKA